MVIAIVIVIGIMLRPAAVTLRPAPVLRPEVKIHFGEGVRPDAPVFILDEQAMSEALLAVGLLANSAGVCSSGVRLCAHERPGHDLRITRDLCVPRLRLSPADLAEAGSMAGWARCAVARTAPPLAHAMACVVWAVRRLAVQQPELEPLAYQVARPLPG